MTYNRMDTLRRLYEAIGPKRASWKNRQPPPGTSPGSHTGEKKNGLENYF